MELYSDMPVAYNSEGVARLYHTYGWWNDDEDDTFATPVKKDKKKSESEKNADLPTDPWDEKN